MSIGLARRSRTKPPAGAVIDYTHPLAQGIVACFPFNEFNGIPAEIVAQKAVKDQTADSMNWASDSRIWQSTKGSTATLGQSIVSKPYSWSWIFGPNCVSTANQHIQIGNTGSNGNLIGIKKSGSTSINWDHWGDTGTYTTPNLDNRYPHIIGSMDPGKVKRLYVDGKYISSITATLFYTGNTNFYFGADNSLLTSGITQVVHFFLWGRTLSPQDVAWLTAEPYCFLKSGWSRRYYVAPPPVTEIDWTASDSITFSDSKIVVLGDNKTFSDTLTFSDSFGYGVPASADPLSDSLSFSDSSGLTVGIPKSFSDTLTFSDVLDSVIVGILEQLSDSINSFSDYYASNMIALNDSMNNWQDLVSFWLGTTRTLSDTLSFSDFLLKMVVIPLVFTDQLNFTDVFATTKAMAHISLTDWLLFLDRLDTFRTNTPNFGDTLAFSDSSIIKLGLNKILSDQLSFTDAVNIQLAGQLRLGLADQLVFSDSITAQVPTAQQGYIRRYLNDSPINQGDNTIPPLNTYSDSGIKSYLRKYLNDV